MNSRPAEGERRAVGGYRAQYRVSATTILENLGRGDLEWIRVADPEAGRVDDLQIASTARVDAYQIKWNEYRGTITLRDLTLSSKDNPSLLYQLVDGWRQLQELYPQRRIVVHLVTNAIASVSTRILPAVKSPPRPYHFAAFLEQAWKPAKRGVDINYSGEWGSVWLELQAASAMSREDFSDFVYDCELDFGTLEPPEDEDHESLTSLLFQTAADPERIVELNRVELLNRLGWQHRFKYRNPHEFEVPRFYRPIAPTVEDLRQRLNDLPGGYLIIVGPPGSGKSTLLTHTLQRADLDIRLIRYYAYVPESQDPSSLRGETLNFLHDVTLRLQEAGFGFDGLHPDPKDRSALLEKLHKQLQALGDDYQATHRKTAILIDGLDHIAREQQPERSLLADLPLQNQIPEGVYFVLGSQTANLEALPPPVHHELSLPERSVNIDRLSPADVSAIAGEVVPELEEEEHQQLFDLSAGHPLALIYIIKQLQLALDKETRAKVLAEAVPYSDDIDAYYWSHWHQVQNDEELTHALGLLSRVRGAVDMVWAAQWLERSNATKIERLFRKYFDIAATNRWSFFHNSFRLFLQARTAQPVLGLSPEEQEINYHTELAERYRIAGDPWDWEAIYHLYSAGDHAAVVELAKADWFQRQAQALRPLEAIQADVRLAIRSAGVLHEPLALIRLTLIAASLEQQNYILDEFAIADLLLDIGDIAQALELIRDGVTLRVQEDLALYLSVRLAEMGMVREGIRIFELAEPYSLLSGKPLSSRLGQDTWDVLEAWGKSAPRFRAPTDVLSVIDQLGVEPETQSELSPEEATANLKRWLCARAAIACAERGAWSDWECYIEWLEDRSQGGDFETLLRSAEAAADIDPDRARNLLRKLLESSEPLPTEEMSLRDIEAQVSVAELALFLNGDKQVAEEWTKEFPPLPFHNNSERDLVHELRFRLYRIRYRLGENRSSDQLIDAEFSSIEWESYVENEEKLGFRQLALMVTTLAALWGRGRRGQKISPSAFLHEISWILDMLHRPPSGKTWLRMEFSATRPKIVEYLVMAAAEQGDEVLETTTHEFVRRWGLGEWPIALRRIAALAIARAGKEAQARELITRFEAEMSGNSNPYQRAEEHWKQARAWIELQDMDAARTELQRMIKSSRGLLDDKDYQSEVWVRWMARANEQDPNNAGERILEMFLRLAAVVNDASGIRDAAEQLMKATFHWSPRRAAYLTKVVQEGNILGHKAVFTNILLASLEASKPPIHSVQQIITHMLMPLVSPHSENLVENLIVVSAEQDGKESAISTASDLERNALVEAFSSDRRAWLRYIVEGLRQIDVSYTPAAMEGDAIESGNQDDYDLSVRSILYLNNGTELALAEACQLINSVSDFCNLVEQEDRKRTRYFHWSTVAEKAVEKTRSSQDIEELSENINKKLNGHEAVKILASLSSRAYELANYEQAESLAKLAIAKSKPTGWDRWLEGGSRLEALRALQIVQPISGRKKAIELYAEDLGGGILSPNRLLPYLDDILALFFDEIPILKLWVLLESYLNELYREVKVESIPEIEFVFSDSFPNTKHDTVAQGLADVLALYLDHPSYVVATNAAGATISILNRNRNAEEIRRALIAAANRSEEAAGRVLLILDAAANELDILPPYSELLHQMTKSLNMMIRVWSSKLVASLEGDVVKVPVIRRRIPSIYSLELPQLSVHRTEEVRDGSEGPVLMRDPARVLRPYDIEARGIAGEAGINEETVLFRASQLLEVFMQEHSWLAGDERIDEHRLNRFLDGSGIRVSFSKPHISSAQRAIAHVTAELWDANRLAPRELQRLAKILFRHDASSYVIEPEPRPGWMHTIGGVPPDADITFSIPENWVEHPEDSLELLSPRTPDGLILLGELSRFAYIGRDKRLEEDRISYIATTAVEEEVSSKIEDSGGENYAFHRQLKAKIDKYKDIRAPGEFFVVMSNPHDMETPGAWWIALNPTFGHKMGWQPAAEDIFGWTNENGDLMATSIWWKDGNLFRYDRNQQSSVGEGWIVIVTEPAYKQICETVSSLRRQGLIRRRVGFAASEGRQYTYARLSLP